MSLLGARIQVPVSLNINNNKASIVSSINREIPKRSQFFQKRKETLLKWAKKDFNFGYENWEEEEKRETSKKKKARVIQNVPVQVANELFRAGFKYLDVRSAEEYNDEHVEDSINIPYSGGVWGYRRDYDFAERVEARFHAGKDAEIIVGCTLGDDKSFKAANDLLNAGFTNVTILCGGYEAWKRSGLPVVADEKRKVPTHTIEIIKKEQKSKAQELFKGIPYD